MRAIADASFLIGLSKIEKIALLGEVFDQVLIPPAVYREVVEEGRGRPGSQEITELACITVREPTNKRLVSMLLASLGPGEAEVLALAHEEDVDLLLLDDLKARKSAGMAGLRLAGLLGFLLTAKNLGLVSQIAPLVQQLRENAFRVGEKVIRDVLEKAGEA